MRLYLLLLILLLQACASTPEIPAETSQASEQTQTPENPDLIAAETVLEQAKLQQAEWMIIEPSMGQQPVTLTQMLEQASIYQDAGNFAEATRLARRIIELAQLGLQQALEQGNALPFYPQ